MNKTLISIEYPHSSISEVYRGIRTNIEYSNLDREIKVINITSTMAGEAKSTTTANLAVMFANKYKKVLLIDMDLRNPSVHRFFSLKNEFGLTDLLFDLPEINEQSNLEKYINKFTSDSMINELSIITAGKEISNVTEVLGSKKIKHLLELLKTQYDLILIDGAPSGIIADGMVVSTLADASIYVVESGASKIEEVKQTITKLKKMNVFILGVVLTKVKSSGQAYGNYGNYYNDSMVNRSNIDV